jgi:hypothetical protein
MAYRPHGKSWHGFYTAWVHGFVIVGMKVLSIKVHEHLDLLLALMLANSPWIFGFKQLRPGAETWVPLLTGAALIVVSLIARKDLVIVSKIFSMRAHLALDTILGVLLVLSPWIFGFYHVVSFPHIMVGGLEIGISLTTDPRALYQPATRQ